MYRYLTLTIVLVISTAAGAQVTWDPNYASYSYGYNSTYLDVEWDGNAVLPTVTQLSDGINMTYNANMLPKYPLEDPNRSLSWGLAAEGTFSVGSLPVQASMSVRLNGKLVNGGGDANQPATNLWWGATLYYDMDESNTYTGGDVAVPTFSANTNDQYVGNGLWVIDETLAMAGTYILSPAYTYIVRYNQSYYMSNLSDTPCSSTFEGGGETAYDGITVTFDFTPVPEPATLGMLAIGGLALLRRRR